MPTYESSATATDITCMYLRVSDVKRVSDRLFRDARSQSGALQLRDVLNNPSLLNRDTGILESVVRGFYLQRAQKFDEK